MAVSPEQFRKTMSLFPTGVAIVTTMTPEGEPYGLTVNSFTSVSLEPPMVLVCLDNQGSGLQFFQESGQFGINILGQKQKGLSIRFATPGTDRTEADYEPGGTGVPLIKGSVARLECSTATTYPGGDHTILLGKVENAEILGRDEDPLLYYQGGYSEMA